MSSCPTSQESRYMLQKCRGSPERATFHGQSPVESHQIWYDPTGSQPILQEWLRMPIFTCNLHQTLQRCGTIIRKGHFSVPTIPKRLKNPETVTRSTTIIHWLRSRILIPQSNTKTATKKKNGQERPRIWNEPKPETWTLVEASAENLKQGSLTSLTNDSLTRVEDLRTAQ